jgi:hypothetical protein
MNVKKPSAAGLFSVTYLLTFHGVFNAADGVLNFAGGLIGLALPTQAWNRP